MSQDETKPVEPTVEPKADDPSKTAKATTKKSQPKKDSEPEFVTFVSAGAESGTLRFGRLNAERYDTNRLSWRVPIKELASYERHHWVLTGRIVRLED